MRLFGGVVAIAIAIVFGVSGSASAASDLSGTWTCCGAGGAAAQIFEISSGVSGVAKLPGGQVFATITGSGGGGKVTIVTTYNSFAPGYVATFVGTLSKDGSTITGSWTSNRGQSGTFTATREKKEETSLDVSVTPVDASGNIGVGDETKVRVKVTASGGKVSGIDVAGLVPSSAAVKVTGKPAGLSGFSLPKGGTRAFTFTVEGAKDGTAKLTARARGKDANGDPVGSSDSASLTVGAKALAIRIVTTPGKLQLRATDKGKVEPGKVNVKVVITNKSKAKIEGVQLVDLRPVPTDLTLALDQLGFDKKAFPTALGTFAPGSSATRTFPLEVTGDGEYEIRALLFYKDKNAKGGTGRETATGGSFEAVVPPLFYEAKRQDDNVTAKAGGAFVKGGKPWYVEGTLKNLSSYKRLCVLPMAPSLRGNASSAGPIDIVHRDLRDMGGPHAGLLGPGKDVPLIMIVDTATTGGTRSSVKLLPNAVVLDRTEPCNDKTAKGAKALGASDKKVVAGSGEFDLAVDVTVELKPPRTGIGGSAANTFDFFGGITRSVLVDSFEQIGGIFALANSVQSTIDQYGLLGKVSPTAVLAYEGTMKGTQLVYTAGQVYADYWRTASAADKQAVYTQVGSVLSRVSGDFFTEGEKTVVEAAGPFMADLEKAYATGDDGRVWSLWGQVTGHVVQQAITIVFTEVLGAKILANQAKLEATAQRASQEWRASKAVTEAVETTLPADAALSTVPAGTKLGLREMEGLWGQDALSDAAFARIAAEEEVLIGVRGRQVESVRKLEQGSVWKHENLKPKNVSDIDIEWLGFRKVDKAEVRFRTYTKQQEAAIRQRIAASNLTEAQKSAVLGRFETRLGESQYVDKIKSFAKKGEINVGFNYRDNGLDQATTRQIRKFDLVDEAVEGGTYYTPLQENLNLYNLRKTGALPPGCKRILASVLCTVTGDMDGVYLTSINGGALSPEKLAKVYEKLQKAGWQHPETLTWINDSGQFYFGPKAKILKGLEQGGGEAMIEYAPDGVRRATYLDLDQSVLLEKGKYRVRVVGGYTGEAQPLVASAK